MIHKKYKYKISKFQPKWDWIYNSTEQLYIAIPKRVSKAIEAIREMEVSNSLLVRDSIANAIKLSEHDSLYGYDKALRKSLLTIFQAECIRDNLNCSVRDLQALVDFFTFCPPGYEVSNYLQAHQELHPVYT